MGASMRIKKKKAVPVAFAVLLSVAILFMSFGLWAEKDNIYSSLKLFSEILNNVHTKYVRSVNTQDLIQAAINAMLKELDPHTAYMDEDEYKELRIGTRGEFGGLGITIGITNDVLTVVSPLEGTPAFEAGILAGDRIVKIEGKSTEGITLQEAVKKLRGKPGTQVNISIERMGVEELLDFTIVRDVIKIDAVPYSGMLTDDVGYIRLARFSAGAGKSLAHAVDSLRSDGAKKFIVDLRDNSGGLLNQAVEVSEIFLEEGEEIVSTKGRTKGANRRYLASYPSVVSGSPLIVLVNNGSASASEILSGTIQDWDRGLVVGLPTYGKGSVQSIIPMSNGTALRLTTAEWYTPSGRLINKERKSEDEETAEAETDSAVVLIDKEIFHTVGGLKRIVYGGGGITPDLELTEDSPNDFETQLVRDRRFFDFAIHYTKARDRVDRPFEADEAVLDEFKAYLDRNEVTYTDAQFDSSASFIARMIELDVSGSLWGMSGRYGASLKSDPWVKKAISLLDMSQGCADLFARAQNDKAEKDRLSTDSRFARESKTLAALL